MQAANSQLPVEFDLTSIWRRPTGIFRYAAEVAKNLLLLEECEPRIRHVPFLKYLFLARGRRTAALLVDPLNAEEIATAMCQVLQDEEMRVRMIEDGRHWVSHFSWEQTARSTRQVLASVSTQKIRRRRVSAGGENQKVGVPSLD